MLNKAYSLALNEAGSCSMKKGRSGREPMAQRVDRDISYATHLGLGLWNVHACMKA
ncbi:MAG: hypothetical protein ACLT8E_08390 [Akkermansia sp.]